MLGPNTELVEGEVVVEQFVASSISSRIGRILERHAGRAYDPGTSVAVIERRGRMQHARSPAMMRGDPRQAALIGVLLGLAAVGWVLIDRRMSGMDRGPGTDLGSLGFYVTAWVVMMAAMMFPSIIPMVDAYRRVQQARRARGHALPGATAVFVGGYLLAWTVFGLAAYALFALARGLGSSLDGDRVAFYAAGGVLVAAGAYQLTPFKDACLSRCRSPVRFVMEHWRSGVRGAAEMGTRPRPVVHRLLLGTDGVAVRARGDERGVDAAGRGDDRDREAAALEMRSRRALSRSCWWRWGWRSRSSRVTCRV